MEFELNAFKQKENTQYTNDVILSLSLKIYKGNKLILPIGCPAEKDGRQ